MKGLTRKQSEMQSSRLMHIIAHLGRGTNNESFTAALSCFPGFLPAVEACSLDWSCIDLGLDPKAKSKTSGFQQLTLACLVGGGTTLKEDKDMQDQPLLESVSDTERQRY